MQITRDTELFSRVIRLAKEAGSSILKFEGKTYEVRPIPEGYFSQNSYGDVLVKDRGKIWMAMFVTKDSYPRIRVTTANGTFRTGVKNALAIIEVQVT